MKTVFTTFDYVEAQMLAAFLRGSNLNAFVWGGETARIGLLADPEGIRVVVPDEEFTEASGLVESYKHGKPEEGSNGH